MNNGGNGGQPARIVEFYAQNTKILKAVQIFPENKDVIILTGKNRQGKSTVIDSIWMALGGREHIPEMPIRQGETEASILLDLGNFSITRKINSKKDYLEIKTKDGLPIPSPQKFLNSQLANLAYNPLEFIRLKPADLTRIIQDMINIKPDRQKLEQLAGDCIWVKTIKDDNPFSLIDKILKMLYDDRTAVNQEIKRLTGVKDSVHIPKGHENLKPTLVTELFEERNKLEKQVLKNKLIRSEVNDLVSKIEQIKKTITLKEDEIKTTEIKLGLLKEEKFHLAEELNSVLDWYSEKADKVDDLVDPDFSSVNTLIANADEHNKLVNEINQLKTTLQNVKEDLSTNQKESEVLTSRMENIKDYRLNLIEQAGLPISGLNFKYGEVTYNNFPLSQASGREKLEISCALCLAQHPEIGIITIDIGWSELDKDGKDVIRKFAEKTGAQIWVTQVMEEPGEEGFHIVDGELVAVDGELINQDC